MPKGLPKLAPVPNPSANELLPAEPARVDTTAEDTTIRRIRKFIMSDCIVTREDNVVFRTVLRYEKNELERSTLHEQT